MAVAVAVTVLAVVQKRVDSGWMQIKARAVDVAVAVLAVIGGGGRGDVWETEHTRLAELGKIQTAAVALFCRQLSSARQLPA